jgi:hypothetical protein
VKVPRQFVEDFNLVASAYRCTPAEGEEMKLCARSDFGAAQRCFEELAREIRAGETKKTERTDRQESNPW